MSDMLVRLYDLPPVEPNEIASLSEKGLMFRRAIGPEYRVVTHWVERHFSKPWAAEAEVTFSRQPVSCFLAIEAGSIVGFACYEATCRNYFGPTGVLESHRGQGIGRMLLRLSMQALRDMGYAYAIIGGVGPVLFYEQAVGARVIEGSQPGIYQGLLKES
jgi:GNAT superfamily N-acetyltransferase